MWPESILLMLLVGLGALALVASAIALLVALFARSRAALKVGLGLLAVVAVPWGALYVWFYVLAPAASGRLARAWSGVYRREPGCLSSPDQCLLVLRADGSCTLDAGAGLGYSGACRWTPDGIDGRLGILDPTPSDVILLWGSAACVENHGQRELWFRGENGSQRRFVRIGEAGAVR
jgi:hypothetical protein